MCEPAAATFNPAPAMATPACLPVRFGPELEGLLKTQGEAPDGLFVFHRNGRRIGDCRESWEAACRRAGLVAHIFPNLRRTAARDERRAGASEGEIMRLCGRRTRSMFGRCSIIDESDLVAAVAKRFEKANATPQPQGSVA